MSSTERPTPSFKQIVPEIWTHLRGHCCMCRRLNVRWHLTVVGISVLYWAVYLMWLACRMYRPPNYCGVVFVYQIKMSQAEQPDVMAVLKCSLNWDGCSTVSEIPQYVHRWRHLLFVLYDTASSFVTHCPEATFWGSHIPAYSMGQSFAPRRFVFITLPPILEALIYCRWIQLCPCQATASSRIQVSYF